MHRMGKTPQTHILLMVDDGKRLTKVWAAFEHMDDHAEAYHYRWGNRDRVVMIAHDAHPRWEAVPLDPVFQLACKDFRVFGVRDGDWQGVGLDRSGSKLSLEQLSAFTLDNTAVKLSKAFREGAISIKWILIIGALVIAGVAGYWFISNQGKSTTPEVPPPAVTQMVDYDR